MRRGWRSRRCSSQDERRVNMGHSSVTVTEKYVGLDVDWSERVPNWTIEI
ncbi:MAG: hypothetical protein HXY41_04470 [Chloroflexi bacterium]|nr:hypothetical protein [Chloroflexota bacterium]